MQIEASRLAVLRTGVVEKLHDTVKVAALQLSTLQLVGSLLHTSTAARAGLHKQKALDIVLEVASTAEWEGSLEVDAFFDKVIPPNQQSLTRN